MYIFQILRKHNPSVYILLLSLPILSGISLSSCTSNPEETETIAYDELSAEERRKPENALAGLEVASGLQATLFASEPMLANPTNMDIDSRGRIWVCEGYNYRPTLNPNNPTKEEGDRILILEDTDGDGKADKNTVFYQGNDVNAALGIWVMGNRAIVSCSPNVFLLTDTDGDDKADKKEVLFTGIGGEQHDHAIHAFTFGPDGKFYFNFGNAGGHLMDKNGKPVTEQTGTKVADEKNPYQQGMVFRCNPDGSDFEVVGDNFRNNYEVAVDSYGTLWQSDNDDDGNKGVRINYVMEYGNYGYRDKVTGKDWRAYRTGMEEEIPKRHWHLNDPGVVPNLLQTGAGSPTGILIYEGQLLPERFRNQIIHADAGPNVVRAYPVTKDGAGYKAEIENIVKGKDQWFRPSDVCIAPDGSLFIADWYDPGVGGHQVGDLQQGRIYRIAPKDTPYEVNKPDLSTPEQAIEALQSPNLSVRYLAWNKLHEGGAKAEPALQKVLRSGNERYRARAFWLLSKIDGKGAQYVQQALEDQNPDIRITGIRMARQLDMKMLPVLQKAAQDESPQVRREVAIALRYDGSPEASKLWATLAQQHDGNDRWYLEALGIGADMYPEKRYQAWMRQVNDNWDTPAGRDIVWRVHAKETIPALADIIRESESDAYHDRLRYFRAFDFLEDPSKQKVLADLAGAQHPNQENITLLALNHLDVDRVKQSPKLKNALASSLESVKGSQTYLELIKRYGLKDYNKDLLALAIDKSQEEAGAEAMKLLLEMDGQAAVKKVFAGNDEKMKSSIITALKRVNNDKSFGILQSVITNQKESLPVRKEAIMAFAGSWGGEDRLLEIVESGDLHADLDSVAAQVLSMTMRNGVYEKAAALLNMPAKGGGENALPPVAKLVTMKGKPENGQAVFARACQTCHVVNGQGIDYGPALSEIGDKLPKEGLYKAILEPSEGISFGYEGYNVTLKDGSQVTGYILNKTEDQLQMRMYGGLTNTYDLANVASTEPMKQSLMFDNLERTMSQQELIDLVEYLTTLRKEGGKISMQDKQ